MVDLISLQTTVVCVEYIFYLLRMEMALHEASLTQTESWGLLLIFTRVFQADENLNVAEWNYFG